jgi:carbamoyl-phosphate synthase large subunit
LVVKPADGSSSQNVFVARTERELDFFLDYVPNAIAQERLEGLEYTVDALLGFDSGFVAAVPRRRLAVRAGEILKGRIDLSQPVIDASRRLLGHLGAIGAIGPLTLQGFLCPDGVFRFTEINPRFGGGLPMTVAAGADFPAWICRAAAGIAPPEISRVRDGAVFSRFDSMVEILPPVDEAPSQG